jgi:mono/diheme cytochrome c family protein
MKLHQLYCAILFCCVPLAARGQEGTEAVRGHAIALSVCAACHVTGSDQPYPPILQQPAPSFTSIARKPGATADALRHFISTTHASAGDRYKMPNPELTDEMVGQVVAYILSLRDQR